MKKKITELLTIVAVVALFGGCYVHSSGNGKTAQMEKDGLSLIAATDLHYFSPELTDNGPAFQSMLARSDGKMTEYADQLTDAFLAEVIAAKPDALILSGDLAFNGERQSHEELAGKLEEVRKQGIAVAVIPGNHDIQYPFSARYEGEEVYRTANVLQDEFVEIYRNMGYDQALSRDEHSLSYVFPVSDKVRLILLDANTPEKQGSVLEETLLWAQQQLKEAKEAGVTVIGVTHQNAMLHNDMFTRGYRIGNYNKVASLYNEYGVPFNLSGHIHIQNIARSDELCEAATGSLAVSPNQYACVEISDQGEITYRTKETDVAGWAKKQKLDNPELLQFSKIAEERFKNRNSRKMMEELEYLDLTDSQREDMGQFAARVNRLYFAGKLWEEKEALKQEEAWKLFQEMDDEIFLKIYMNSMMDGGTQPDNELLIPGGSRAETVE